MLRSICSDVDPNFSRRSLASARKSAPKNVHTSSHGEIAVSGETGISSWTPAIAQHYLDHALERFTADGSAHTTDAYRWRYHAAGVGECEADLVNDHSDAIRTALPIVTRPMVTTPGLSALSSPITISPRIEHPPAIVDRAPIVKAAGFKGD